MASILQTVVSASALLLAVNSAYAQQKVLNFAVQPTYSPEQITEVYKPFLAYLQKSTGYQIKIVTFRNFSSYWQEMREKRGWDLTFDEAHFTDYRIQRMGFEPLVRAAESGAYVLASSEDLGAGNTDALLGEKIAALPAPSLGYALLLEYYPNPMQQPDVRTNSASFLDAVDALFADESRGTMVPASVAADYPNLFEVIRTREYAGIAVSASSSLPADVKAKISEALLKMHEDQDAFAALDELGISQFVKAVPADFRGAERVLKNFYGYGQ